MTLPLVACISIDLFKPLPFGAALAQAIAPVAGDWQMLGVIVGGVTGRGKKPNTFTGAFEAHFKDNAMDAVASLTCRLQTQYANRTNVGTPADPAVIGYEVWRHFGGGFELRTIGQRAQITGGTK